MPVLIQGCLEDGILDLEGISSKHILIWSINRIGRYKLR